MPKKSAKYPNKEKLFHLGSAMVRKFCRENGLKVPEIQKIEKDDPLACLNACAWYRPGTISIKIWDCAHVGVGGAGWSYPGYVIDRTPYGVLCHELGHHVDVELSDVKFRYSGDFSLTLFEDADEIKLTNYCPNSAEWFAEMFRLFVTNPDLLSKLRPRTFDLISERLNPTELRKWIQVLRKAPQRTRLQAEKKIHQATKMR